jgi:hypothetical protein
LRLPAWFGLREQLRPIILEGAFYLVDFVKELSDKALKEFRYREARLIISRRSIIDE